MTLSPREHALLLAGDRNAVIAQLAKIPTTGWLQAANSFQNGSLPQRWNRVGPSRHQHVVELISVLGPKHCIDGWSFLARSLSALGAGNAHAARHFAYYAELRAALSILASFGIGIFNTLTCVVTKTGMRSIADQTRRPTIGTHAMAWLALEAWATDSSSGQEIARAITIRKETFNDCIRALWPGTTSRPSASQLILTWGVDLKAPLSDRNARNQSSYTPNAFNILNEDATDCLNFYTSFWNCFEPDPGDPFLLLDRHLLRLLIEAQSHAVGISSTHRAADIKKRHGNLPAQIQTVASSDFLVRITEGVDLFVIQEARRSRTPPEASDMICRAGLLLRTATAFVQTNLFSAGVNFRTGVASWLPGYGERLGFWPTGSLPSPLFDLWFDIRQALDDVAAIKSAAPQFNRYVWSSSPSNGFPRLCEAERISLWSLCS
jgi:hypothetical protein